ncbi:MAG TPA: hypothetical protein VFE15_16990 [Marmoricola sp.]|nr:hypothetical protein [Marmoricola sp.]
MRTAHYAFILIAQIALLFAMFAFGAKYIDVKPPQGTATTYGVQEQPPADHGVGTLERYLAN